MNRPIPFVQMYAFVVPVTMLDDDQESPCDERTAVRYQVWGWHHGKQAWIKTLFDGAQLDGAEAAAREWHDKIASDLCCPAAEDPPSNECLQAWAADLRRLRLIVA